jgi:hypothetical protein
VDLDPKLVADLAFQRGEKIGQEVVGRLHKEYASFEFTLVAGDLQDVICTAGERSDFQEQLLGLLPEDVLTKLFSFAQFNKQDFAYRLKLKATWVAEGIEKVSRARRAAKYVKTLLWRLDRRQGKLKRKQRRRQISHHQISHYPRRTSRSL